MKVVSKEQFAANTVWKFLELFCLKISSLVISTVLARLLLPEVYGIVALTTVFITFSDIFILNGFNIALIRKETIRDVDYSTVLFISISFALIIYIILYLLAPFVSDFYNTPVSSSVLRAISLGLLFRAVSTVIKARGTRELRIKEMSLCAVVSTTFAGVVSIVMAYKGWGVWALVFQQLVFVFIEMLMLLFVYRYKFPIKICWDSARQMINFTKGVLGTSFLDFLGNNISSLVIYKAYSPIDLGYYNRGFLYPETISLNTFNAINSVMLPAISSRQNDSIEMKRVVRKIISFTEYIICPLMFGLIGVSDTFVKVLLTEKWLPCVPILVLSCLYYAINPIRTIGYNVFYAKGESSKSVQIEVFRFLLMFINLLMSIILFKKSIYFFTMMNIFVSFLVVYLTHLQVKEILNYSFKEFFSDILPSFMMSIGIIISVKLISRLDLPICLILVVQILTGISTYVVLSILTRSANFYILLDYLKKRLNYSK